DDIYLSENTSADGTKLWQSDGLFQSLIAEDPVSSTLRLQPTQSGVAFSRSGALSMTDGTAVADFPALELVSPPEGIGSDHWYSDTDAWYRVDEQLWRTDLVNDTSELLVDLSADPELSIHEILGESGGTFYFTIQSTVDGLLEETQICAVDDSTQGYSMVLTFDGDMGMISVSSDLYTVAGRALLLSEIDFQDWELHELMGPAAPATSISAGAGRPSGMKSGESWLAFLAAEGLWRTDGSAGGTALIPESLGLALHKIIDSWALVSGVQAGRGLEFALIDLPLGQQVLLPEVQAGPLGTVVGDLVVHDDILWTSAYRLDVGQELFRLDLAPFLAAPPIFTDDFESGDTAKWSFTQGID
ncbi:MAG: hypothetical protein AAF368_13070, partial [Planctomycetota bacterium]